MNATALANNTEPGSFANDALNASARLWFVTAATGQLIFASYITAYYGGATAHGELTSATKILPHGIIAGDLLGNVMLVMHLFLAAVITLGGPIQLIPQIRSKAPAFHRWNGRLYVLTAIVMSIGGLYLVWIRGTIGSPAQRIGISVNALMIMLCAAMAWRYAWPRNRRTADGRCVYFWW